MTIFRFLFICFCAQSLSAQIADATHIKTFQMISGENRFSRNVHSLKNTINLSFDDTKGNQDEYYYKVIHCQIDWTPSNLPSSYYIDGFDNFQINDFENSFGTLQNYTHYKFTLPNENTKITKTGNYIIQILDEDDEIVAERNITLYQQKAVAAISISESRDLVNFNKKQAVSLILNTQDLPVNFPDQELKTFIFQNGDQQIKTPYLKPTFIQGNLYNYRPTEEMEFLAGNEFYYFDNNEILRNSRFILRSYRDDDVFRTILFTNPNRANQTYVFNPDINGNFLIRNFNSTNTGTEAEYSYVHFSLKNNKSYNGKDIYIYGAFNNYQLTEENLLKLDETEQYLTADILLKQGFYNYDYITTNGEKINKTVVSGSYFETENNYECLVYFQPQNSIYYQVVGYGLSNSKQQIEN
ncbi:type IX secretion system plug protein [Wenyingzhuangia sp. IMCC45574]